jgi:hypothetical protein
MSCIEVFFQLNVLIDNGSLANFKYHLFFIEFGHHRTMEVCWMPTNFFQSSSNTLPPLDEQLKNFNCPRGHGKA